MYRYNVLIFRFHTSSLVFFTKSETDLMTVLSQVVVFKINTKTLFFFDCVESIQTFHTNKQRHNSTAFKKEAALQSQGAFPCSCLQGWKASEWLFKAWESRAPNVESVTAQFSVSLSSVAKLYILLMSLSFLQIECVSRTSLVISVSQDVLRPTQHWAPRQLFRRVCVDCFKAEF